MPLFEGTVRNHMPWPSCGQCHKPVETMDQYRDLGTRDWVVVVRCHGERDEARLSEMDFWGMLSLEATVAFRQPGQIGRQHKIGKTS